jgi:hypothetical protein
MSLCRVFIATFIDCLSIGQQKGFTLKRHAGVHPFLLLVQYSLLLEGEDVETAVRAEDSIR